MLNMLLTTFICNNIAALLLKMFLVLVFSIFFVFQGVTLQKVVITDPNWIDDMVTGCADVPVDSDPSIINLTTPDTTPCGTPSATNTSQASGSTRNTSRILAAAADFAGANLSLHTSELESDPSDRSFLGSLKKRHGLGMPLCHSERKKSRKN